MSNPRKPIEILRDVKALAVEYYAATGKPLGVTGEIAEVEAAHLLGLDLEDARSPGDDATRSIGDTVETIQIKGRWKRAGASWGKVPSINTTHSFDTAMLVLLEGDAFTLRGIWQMPRDQVLAILDAPGSKARNERRSMNVSKFQSAATRVWPFEDS